MSNKKKLLTAFAAVMLIGVLLAVVLLGVYFGTKVDPEDLIEIPIEYLADANKMTVDKVNGVYLGHPDLVINDAGVALVAYPSGHGKGAVILKQSTDYGATWSERRTDIPASWVNSQETPTLYNLGGNRIVMISGCPIWGDEYKADGFNSSLSLDGGKTWDEFTNWYGTQWAQKEGKQPFDGIVAMSSLTQLKDQSGNDIQRWMGTFHDHSYLNYKSYLTIEDGKAVWTTPVPLIPAWREIESYSGMCELEIIRAAQSPSNTLIMIARANNKVTRSMISFSDDEGETWTKPTQLPYALTGDRHKAEYDPATGKLAISFRQYVREKKSALAVKPGGITLGWTCWVGTTADLLSYRDTDPTNDKFGEKLIVLGTDYQYKGDCGYAGTAVNQDGEFLMVSYGRFDRKARQPYIMAVKFKL